MTCKLTDSGLRVIRDCFKIALKSLYWSALVESNETSECRQSVVMAAETFLAWIVECNSVMITLCCWSRM